MRGNQAIAGRERKEGEPKASYTDSKRLFVLKAKTLEQSLWKVTWPEYKNPKNSNSLQVTLVKTMPTIKEPSEAKSVAWICRNSR